MSIVGNLAAAGFYIFPKKAVSTFTGMVSRVALPRTLRGPLYRTFSALYGVNSQEAELPLQDYASFSDFFSRRLKPGLRPVGSGLVSPVDGVVVLDEVLTEDRVLSIKGRPFTVSELLASGALGAEFSGGRCIVFYLSPKDYHRIHTPLQGELRRTLLVGGTLFPVSPGVVRALPKVYAENERVVFLFRQGDLSWALVAVGALNVGSVGLEFETPAETVISRVKHGVREQREFPPGFEFGKGDLLASFRLGSSVALLFPRGRYVGEASLVGRQVKMGETLYYAEQRPGEP